MNQSVFTSLLVFLVCAVAAPAPAQPGSAELTQDEIAGRIRDWVAPLAERRDFSGVIMVQRGEAEPTALTFGYADWVTGAPMSPQARFPAGSITGSLTAAMIRRLAAEGRISLDDSVDHFIPELAAYDTVRIGDILAHTAGLDRNIPRGALSDPRSDTLVAWMANQPAPAAGPHGRAYSDPGYGLLAVIIERATNARFETLMTTEFLIPTDMQASRITRQPGGDAAEVPSGYVAGPLPLDLRAPMADQPILGAAGLVVPVRDMLRLADAVRTRRIDLFLSDGRMAGSWQAETIAGETVYTIQGSTPGYSAGISILPGRDLAIAYGANIDSYANREIRDALNAIALDQALAPASTRPMTDGLTAGHLDAIGLYSGSPFGPVAIEPSEGGLDLVLLERDQRYYLTPTGADALNWRSLNARFSYGRDEAGRVASIVVSPVGLITPTAAWTLVRTDLPPLPAIEPINAGN